MAAELIPSGPASAVATELSDRFACGDHRRVGVHQVGLHGHGQRGAVRGADRAAHGRHGDGAQPERIGVRAQRRALHGLELHQPAAHQGKHEPEAQHGDPQAAARVAAVQRAAAPLRRGSALFAPPGGRYTRRASLVAALARASLPGSSVQSAARALWRGPPLLPVRRTVGGAGRGRGRRAGPGWPAGPAVAGRPPGPPARVRRSRPGGAGRPTRAAARPPAALAGCPARPPGFASRDVPGHGQHSWLSGRAGR